MNGRAQRFCLLVLAGLIVSQARAEPGDWPPEARPALGRFVGEWDTHTSIRNEGPPVREFQTEGRAVCRKTLEGGYFEFRTSSVPPGQADLQVMTYDVKTGRYQQWVFDSDGYHHEAEGRWDPATSTLTWEGHAEGTTFVIEDRWTAPNRLEWTMKRTAADGRQLQSIKGVLTRSKAR
jgi:hypothetical protein